MGGRNNVNGVDYDARTPHPGLGWWTSADIGLQSIFHALAGAREVKPVQIEVTTALLFHIGVLWIVPVGDDGQEPLVAFMTADIFRGRERALPWRARPCPAPASAWK